MKWGVITVRLPHLTDVPQVVTVVVAEREVVLAVVADVLPCLAVALLEQVLVDSSVPQCESTAEQGVRTAGVERDVSCACTRQGGSVKAANAMMAACILFLFMFMFMGVCSYNCWWKRHFSFPGYY